MDSDVGQFIAGLVTGEGCFFITLQMNHGAKWQVTCGFSIRMRADDRELVKMVWQALNFSGNIFDVLTKRYQYQWDSIRRHDSVGLQIRSVKELVQCVIPFFERYPLRGQKRRNYELWKEAVQIMERGEHRTGEGFQRIMELKEQMNRYQGQDEDDENLSEETDSEN
jgi:hypothetical protein